MDRSQTSWIQGVPLDLSFIRLRGSSALGRVAVKPSAKPALPTRLQGLGSSDDTKSNILFSQTVSTVVSPDLPETLERQVSESDLRRYLADQRGSRGDTTELAWMARR